MNIGIVYYSRTGNTREIASIIEKKLKDKNKKVDLIEIHHTKKPGFIKAGRSAITKKDLPIENTDYDLKKYDLILVGYPTWAGRPASYVNTFMTKAENIKGKKYAVFNTCAGPIEDSRKTFDIIKDDLNNLGLSTTGHFLSLKMKKVKILDGEQNIDEFVSKIIKG
jgi:flavodoxin